MGPELFLTLEKNWAKQLTFILIRHSGMTRFPEDHHFLPGAPGSRSMAILPWSNHRRQQGPQQPWSHFWYSVHVPFYKRMAPSSMELTFVNYHCNLSFFHTSWLMGYLTRLNKQTPPSSGFHSCLLSLSILGLVAAQTSHCCYVAPALISVGARNCQGYCIQSHNAILIFFWSKFQQISSPFTPPIALIASSEWVGQ